MPPEEDPSPPHSAEHLIVVEHDGRIVRTPAEGLRRPWQRLMLIADDHRLALYTDTDPFQIRLSR